MKRVGANKKIYLMTSVKTSPEQKKPGARSSETIIDILVVIDTEAIKQYCVQNGITPSTTPSSPTQLGHGNNFLLCTGASNIQNQGTGDLTFTAGPGDIVNFRASSIYANSDDAVILYGIQPTGSTNVFNNFQYERITRTGAVMPNPATSNGIPAAQGTITFNSYTAQVAQSGTELFWVQYGLYIVDPQNKENQILFGYFAWDPTIIVQ